MAEFVLTEPPVPSQVRRRTAGGLLSATVHLSDHDGRTLCGQRGELLEVTDPVSCQKCASAVNSKARIRREIR